MNETRTLKIINGDSIVANVKETADGYVLSRPVLVFPVGPGQLAMQPWLSGQDMDKEVIVLRQHVIAISSCDPDIEKGYGEKYHGVPAIQLATNADATALKQAEKRIMHD